MKPRSQATRSNEQINVLGNEPRGNVVIWLLSLGISNVSVGLLWAHVVSGEVRDVKDIHRSSSCGPPVGSGPKNPGDYGLRLSLSYQPTPPTFDIFSFIDPILSHKIESIVAIGGQIK